MIKKAKQHGSLWFAAMPCSKGGNDNTLITRVICNTIGGRVLNWRKAISALQKVGVNGNRWAQGIFEFLDTLCSVRAALRCLTPPSLVRVIDATLGDPSLAVICRIFALYAKLFAIDLEGTVLANQPLFL